MNLRGLRRHWDAFGRSDPFWAVLSEPGKKGNRWAAEEFFKTGADEIEGVLAYLRARGFPLRRGRALDFGCGVGRLSQALALHFDEVVGVDIAPSMLELARGYNRHGERCRYVLNESDRLPMLSGQSFDLVYTNIVLQHIAPRYVKRYLAEFVRVLAPGGLLVFQLPSRVIDAGATRGLKGALKQVLPQTLLEAYRRLKRSFEFPRMEGHGLRPDEVRSVLEAAGARLLDIVPDRSPGPAWESFRYCATRITGAPAGQLS